MASEYLTKKARREAPPPEEPKVYTPKEKALNWWHYHWYWFLIGAAVLWIGGSMLWNGLGIGRIKPDYIFAYVADEPLGEAQNAVLENALALLGTDVNGDGRVTVEVRQYGMNRAGDMETALFYNQAADAKLIADITKNESYFFLTDDPARLQRSYQILANTDGTPPDEFDYGAEGKAILWTNCPALAALDVDSAVTDGLYLGRRFFYGDAAKGRKADVALWEIMTKGATR